MAPGTQSQEPRNTSPSPPPSGGRLKGKESRYVVSGNFGGSCRTVWTYHPHLLQPEAFKTQDHPSLPLSPVPDGMGLEAVEEKREGWRKAEQEQGLEQLPWRGRGGRSPLQQVLISYSRCSEGGAMPQGVKDGQCLPANGQPTHTGNVGCQPLAWPPSVSPLLCPRHCVHGHAPAVRAPWPA